jgi:hypothetical protein
LEQVIGGQEGEFMRKSKVKYTDEPIGKIKIIPNFLPPPEELVLKEETVKVTLFLTKNSIEFFKHEAEQQHVQYQKMIRVLLDLYAQNCSRQPKRRKAA